MFTHLDQICSTVSVEVYCLELWELQSWHKIRGKQTSPKPPDTSLKKQEEKKENCHAQQLQMQE